MAGGYGGAGPGAGHGRPWDVAPSFAGAQRDYAAGSPQRARRLRFAAFTTPMSRSGCGERTWPRNCPDLRAGVRSGRGVHLRRLRRPGLDRAGTPHRMSWLAGMSFRVI